MALGVTFSLPAVALAPFQPPEAVQAVALVLDQVRVAEPPGWMLPGEAEKVIRVDDDLALHLFRPLDA